MSKKGSISGYGFIAFPLAVLFLFTLLPTVLGLALSLFDWDGSGTPRFLGLANFRALFQDPDFSPALRNTLVFVIASVPPTVVLAFLVSVAVNAGWFRGKALVRTLLFTPTIISMVAIGFVWRWLLDEDAGLLNFLLRSAGWEQPPNWMSGRDGYPLHCIIAVAVWRQIGFCLVLYLAALSQVNESLHEAAEIDGASRASAILHVTWPQVAPTTVFLLATGVINALQVFDLVFVMTNQSETARTNVLNLMVYREFTQGSLGYAAAVGVVIFAVTMLATGAQAWLVRDRVRSRPARIGGAA